MVRRPWLLGWAFALAGAACAAAPEAGVAFSGYYKNLLVRGETGMPPAQGYLLDLNRVHLKLLAQPTPVLAVELQYDNELLAGNYLKTAQFQMTRDRRTDSFWDLDADYLEGSDLLGRHRLYRAFATLSLGDTDVRLGRQRIAWGTGRFWSPLDLLNPIDPTQLEQDQRPGVDALQVEHKLDPLSRLSVVYVPSRDHAQAGGAVSWHGNLAGTDYSLIVADLHRARTVGMDFAGELGAAGWRAEVAETRPAAGRRYRRVLLGLDYAFANSLDVTAELYYNGAGTIHPAEYDFPGLSRGRIQNVARHYVGLQADYDLTPLLRWKNALVINLDDHSHYYSPSLSYSLASNVVLDAGIQHFGGGRSSEYGRLRDLYYVSLQWFF